MPDDYNFNSSFMGFDKKEVQAYIKNLCSEYDLELFDKQNEIMALDKKCLELSELNEKFLNREQESELLKEQISNALIETTERMSLLARKSEQNAGRIVAEAKDTAVKRMSEAEAFFDEKVQSANEYYNIRSTEADTIFETMRKKAEQECVNILLEAKQKAESIISDARDSAEKERSEVDAMVEKSREELVGLRETIMTLRNDVTTAAAFFNGSLTSVIEKTDI